MTWEPKNLLPVKFVSLSEKLGAYKHPEMKLWEDSSDMWVWDSVEEDANPVCYYDEDEEEYVVAPGSEELLA